ncbi:acyl-CoA thioesterase [Rhodococcus wratislaviensis]|uniref:acyl-CoA thioesterase n=1 Tax=Rhodococcus wratislaviensis TaxID=44752 RepID=UPI00351916C9
MTVISVPLRWCDMDQFGHLYHATLVALLDEARSRWLGQLDLSDSENFVIARVDVSYKNEILYADGSLEVEIEAERIGSSSVTTRETVRTATSGVCAEATCTMVQWDTRTRSSKPINAGDRKALLAVGAGAQRLG